MARPEKNLRLSGGSVEHDPLGGAPRLEKKLLPAPLQANTRPWKCPKCGELLGPGEGLFRRNRWCDVSSKGRWYFEHPGCPGKPRWHTEKDGWVYVCTGCGPKADFIKVGSTWNGPSDRVTDLYRDNQTHTFGAAIFYDGVPLAAIQVWAAYTDDRWRDETRTQEKLRPYLVPEFGDEIFAAPLPTVLDALAEIVSPMIEQYSWSREFFYRDADQEITQASDIHGYPLTTRASLERTTTWQKKKIEKQTEKLSALQQQVEEMQMERDQLKALVERLTPSVGSGF